MSSLGPLETLGIKGSSRGGGDGDQAAKGSSMLSSLAPLGKSGAHANASAALNMKVPGLSSDSEDGMAALKKDKSKQKKSSKKDKKASKDKKKERSKSKEKERPKPKPKPQPSAADSFEDDSYGDSFELDSPEPKPSQRSALNPKPSSKPEPTPKVPASMKAGAAGGGATMTLKLGQTASLSKPKPVVAADSDDDLSDPLSEEEPRKASGADSTTAPPARLSVGGAKEMLEGGDDVLGLLVDKPGGAIGGPRAGRRAAAGRRAGAGAAIGGVAGDSPFATGGRAAEPSKPSMLLPTIDTSEPTPESPPPSQKAPTPPLESPPKNLSPKAAIKPLGLERAANQDTISAAASRIQKAKEERESRDSAQTVAKPDATKPIFSSQASDVAKAAKAKRMEALARVQAMEKECEREAATAASVEEDSFVSHASTVSRADSNVSDSLDDDVLNFLTGNAPKPKTKSPPPSTGPNKGYSPSGIVNQARQPRSLPKNNAQEEADAAAKAKADEEAKRKEQKRREDEKKRQEAKQRLAEEKRKREQAKKEEEERKKKEAEEEARAAATKAKPAAQKSSMFSSSFEESDSIEMPDTKAEPPFEKRLQHWYRWLNLDPKKRDDKKFLYFAKQGAELTLDYPWVYENGFYVDSTNRMDMRYEHPKLSSVKIRLEDARRLQALGMESSVDLSDTGSFSKDDKSYDDDFESVDSQTKLPIMSDNDGDQKPARPAANVGQPPPLNSEPSKPQLAAPLTPEPEPEPLVTQQPKIEPPSITRNPVQRQSDPPATTRTSAPAPAQAQAQAPAGASGSLTQEIERKIKEEQDKKLRILEQQMEAKEKQLEMIVASHESSLQEKDIEAASLRVQLERASSKTSSELQYKMEDLKAQQSKDIAEALSKQEDDMRREWERKEKFIREEMETRLKSQQQRYEEDMKKMARRHEEDLEASIEQSKSAEYLNTLAAQLSSSTKNMEELQQKVGQDWQQSLAEREEAFASKEAMLQAREKESQERMEAAEAEQKRAVELQHQFEETMKQMRIEHEQEKARLTQEHTRLQTMHLALEAEKQSFHAQFAEHHRQMETTQAHFLREKDAWQRKYLEEMRNLERERSRVAAEKESLTIQEADTQSRVQDAKLQLEKQTMDLRRQKLLVEEQRQITEEERAEFLRQRQSFLTEKEEFQGEADKITKLGIEVQRESQRLDSVRKAAYDDKLRAEAILEGVKVWKAEVEREKAQISAQTQLMGASRKSLNETRLELARERQSIVVERELALQTAATARKVQDEISRQLTAGPYFQLTAPRAHIDSSTKPAWGGLGRPMSAAAHSHVNGGKSAAEMSINVSPGRSLHSGVKIEVESPDKSEDQDSSQAKSGQGSVERSTFSKSVDYDGEGGTSVGELELSVQKQLRQYELSRKELRRRKESSSLSLKQQQQFLSKLQSGNPQPLRVPESKLDLSLAAQTVAFAGAGDHSYSKDISTLGVDKSVVDNFQKSNASSAIGSVPSPLAQLSSTTLGDSSLLSNPLVSHGYIDPKAFHSDSDDANE